MANIPKRQHFLPEFYLNGFSQHGQLWLYDRKRKQYRSQSPRKTAVINHYYTFENNKGEKSYEIETLLSQVEGRAKKVIAKLESRCQLTLEERLNLAQFITLLMVRTPRFHADANAMADAAAKHLIKHAVPDVESAGRLVRSYEQNSAGNTEGHITAESMLDFIHKEKFKIKLHRAFVLSAMIEQAQKATLPFALMDWTVVHTRNGNEFITTDQPTGFVVSEEFRNSAGPVLGFASPLITKLVPLSQFAGLSVGKEGCRLEHVDLEPQQVRDFNLAVASECDGYVIGRDEALVREIVIGSRVDTSNPGTRIRVEHTPHPTDPHRTFLVTRRVPADAPDTNLKIAF